MHLMTTHRQAQHSQTRNDVFHPPATPPHLHTTTSNTTPQSVVMDDEGFPLLPPGAMLQPVVERPDSVDQESGEATGRKVVMLRKPRLDNTQSRETLFRVRPHLLQSSFRLHHNPRISQRFTFHQELSRVPSLWSEENTSFVRHMYRPHSESQTDPTRAMSKVPFRVPQLPPEHKTQKQNEVTISIWREFCRGPLVYEDANSSFSDLKDQCMLWPHLQALFGDFAVMAPACCVWLVRAILVMLKVFIPWLGLQLSYFHFLHVHLKIHMTGEKKGVRPIFVGAAHQGPMIYSIRHLCCPYCRHNKQFKVTLRYFETLLRERQCMAASLAAGADVLCDVETEVCNGYVTSRRIVTATPRDGECEPGCCVSREEKDHLL